MKYEFDQSYRFSKASIEKAMDLDKAKFYDAIKQELHSHGFFEVNNFHLGDDRADDVFCLFEDRDFWVVTYIEKGTRFAPAFFVDPEHARLFLLSKLISSKRKN